LVLGLVAAFDLSLGSIYAQTGLSRTDAPKKEQKKLGGR